MGRIQLALLMLLLSIVCPLASTGQQEGRSLALGNPAPDFVLAAASKDTILFSGVRLSEVLGKDNVILAFYPADWSGGCTQEMCTLRDNFAGLASLGALVYGISGDYVYAHHAWAKHLNLPFTLLSDHRHEVSTAYHSYNGRTGYNLRTIYIIDRRGRIAYMDLAYKAGSAESFQRLQEALLSLPQQ